MSEFELPDLPSDEELGIEDLSLDEEGSTVPSPPAEKKKAKKKREKAQPAEGAAPPVTGMRAALTVVALFALLWATSPDQALPPTAPVAAPDSVFSSGRAMMTVREMARRPHPTGAPEHDRVRAYLLERLEKLELEPEVRTTTSLIRRGSRARAATVRNLLARIPGTASTGAILLTAHYDTQLQAPGAGDDASGVAAILEAIRAVQTGEPLRNDLIVLITDAEELGLLGARAFVRDHPWMDDVQLVLSVEMRGGGGPSIMFQTGPENGWIIEALKRGDPKPFANSMSFEVYERLPNDTDFTPFLEAGKQGLNFAAIGRAHVYHQAYDTPENYEEATLQHHGLHVLGMLRELGDADLSEVNGPHRVFFRLPLIGLVTYGAQAVVPLAIFLALFTVAVAGLAWRAYGAGGIVAGLVLTVVVGAAAGGAGWGMFRGATGFHPEFGALHAGAFHSEGWYVASLAAVTLALFLAGHLILVRRFALGAIAAGAALVPAALATALGFAAPLAAMNVQWPLFAALLIAALLVLRSGKVALVDRLARLLAAAVVLAFLFPVVHLVWVAMDFAAAPVLGAAMVLTAALLLPLLDELRGWGWMAPLGALVFAGVLFGVGFLHARPSPDRPAPSTLTYTVDHDAGTQRWRTAEGQEWAREHLAGLGALGDPVTADSATSLLRHEAATTVDVEPPAVGVALDAAGSGGFRARLAISSRIGAEYVRVRIDPDEARLTAVNGVPISEDEEAVTTLEHWGRPEGAILLDLILEPGRDTLTLPLVEHHLRPGEIVGHEFFDRPPHLAPDITNASDRLIAFSAAKIPLRRSAPTEF